MHEMSMCESIVQILEDQAQVHGYSRVKAVRLEIGPFSCADPEAMRFCFDATTRNSLADGARLDILMTEGEAWCFACSLSVSINTRTDPCPRCGSHQLQVTAGEEMRIKDMEVA